MSEQLVRDLRDSIQSRQAEMRAFLEALVRTESPSDVPESQLAIQALLSKSLRDAGFRVRKIRGRGRSGGLLEASPRPRRRECAYQLLIGHTDTVWPLGTLSRMPVEIDGEKLMGPGSFDMKGGLAQLVFALKAIHDLGIELRVTPVVLLNTDEEIGSGESRRWIRRYARNAVRCFVLEPALGRLEGSRPRARGLVSSRSGSRGEAPTRGLIPRGGQCYSRALLRHSDASGAERLRGGNLGQRGPD